jgi:hypothetical protein
MEALTAVQVGLLTIYDMCKAADRGMVMGTSACWKRAGGKSGTGWPPNDPGPSAGRAQRAAGKVAPVGLGAAPALEGRRGAGRLTADVARPKKSSAAGS